MHAPVSPQLSSTSLGNKKLRMASEKGHNPWLAKSCMFGETKIGQCTIAEAKVVRSLCIRINQWFPFPLVIFFPGISLLRKNIGDWLDQNLCSKFSKFWFLMSHIIRTYFWAQFTFNDKTVTIPFFMLLWDISVLRSECYLHFCKWRITSMSEFLYSNLSIHFFFFFFFFYVRAYLGINSKKQITNGKDHKVTADKYTPR